MVFTRIGVLSVVLAVTSVTAVAPPATADHSNPRRWSAGSTGVTEVVVVDRTGHAGWQVATQNAVNEWNRAGSNLRLRWTSGTGSCGFQDHTINVCMVYGQSYDGTARYQWGYDGYLSGATVTLDTERTANYSASSRNALACHEIGHDLVVDHTVDSGSCMNSPVYVERPNAHDYQALLATYGAWTPPSTSTTIAPTTTTSTTVAPTTTTSAPTTTTTPPKPCRSRHCR